MDETERPKTPRRRKTGDDTGNATSEAGTPVKPARRRAAPKKTADPETGAATVPAPRMRTRSTTRAPRGDGASASADAPPTPKPVRKRTPRAAAPATMDIDASESATPTTTPLPEPSQATIRIEAPPAPTQIAAAPAEAPSTVARRAAAPPDAAVAPVRMASGHAHADVQPIDVPRTAPVVADRVRAEPPPAVEDPATPAIVPSFARKPTHAAHTGDGWSGRESAFRKLAAPALAAIRRFGEALNERSAEADTDPGHAATARPADTSKRSGQVLDWLLERVPPQHRRRVHDYLVLMRMDRPIGALLLLWPTWWALWFAANDFPPPGMLVVFTLGVFVMRSAGCVINDYADHGWLDANVERTAGRPMATGRVSKKEAIALFGGLLVLAFVLVLFTNALTIKLSFVGAALAAVYPFTKRVTHLAQVVLGAAFGWSIPMAFAAVTNSLPPLCWLLFLANILFSVVYDTEYAMVDRDEDVRVGAKSTAILFGDAVQAIVGVLMATFLFAMLLAGTRAHLHWPYFLGLAVAAGLLGWQQWLMRGRDRSACFAAFRNNNWVGFAIWFGLLFALAIR